MRYEFQVGASDLFKDKLSIMNSSEEFDSVIKIKGGGKMTRVYNTEILSLVNQKECEIEVDLGLKEITLA
jgi:hypothetical protein